ncbi:MAG: TrkA family potassium uptake protein [Chloroflexota bacterium]
MMKVLIMGCGRVGAKLAELLDKAGQKVTVLDIDEYSFRRLPADFGGTLLVGSGTDQEKLKKAGVSEADFFLTLTQGDNRNIMAAQIAKHIFNVPRVICRIYDPRRKELFGELGIETISPTTIFAEMLKERITGTDQG